MLDYYAQQQADRLNSENTVYDEIAKNAALAMVPELRTLLGAFLFSGDTVNKKVAVLSGGEKSRLALAKMLLQPSNVLILDEPTNHLDIRTKDVVREALLQFGGTFLIVSHDRYFLTGLVTKVLEMQHGQLIVYPGTFEEFLHWKEKMSGIQSLEAEVGSSSQFIAHSSKSQIRNPQSTSRHPQAEMAETLAVIQEAKRGKLTYEQQKAARAEQQKRERRLADIEKKVATLEERKLALEQLMADGTTFTDPQRARELSQEYEALKQTLEEQYVAWTELAEVMDAS